MLMDAEDTLADGFHFLIDGALSLAEHVVPFGRNIHLHEEKAGEKSVLR